MNILVTGFEPFDGACVNPSWEAVRLLPGTVAGHTLHTLRLPVVYGQAARLMLQAARRLDASLIVMTGLAAGRRDVTPELVALNYRLARIPDNAGQCFSGVPIVPDAPAAYMTPLPVHAMVSTLQAEGLPASLSLSAGAYVCNDVYFAALHASYQALFVHVPLPEVLPPERVAHALTLCIREACQ